MLLLLQSSRSQGNAPHPQAHREEAPRSNGACSCGTPGTLRQPRRTSRTSRSKFGLDSDEVIDVVNLKLPTEMFGSFGAADGVYPAYHMNKLHWISVLLPDAPDDVVQFLVNVSFEATKAPKKKSK